jgi:hypothetical protein
MVRSFRTLLTWLLLLAIPVQGMAAATMAFCGPSHHAGASREQPRQGASAAHVHHGSDAPGAHHHRGAAPPAGAPTDAAAPATLTQADDQKCSACASCCSFSAVPSAALAVPAAALCATRFNAVVPRIDAFTADGPDRPPRSLLA